MDTATLNKPVSELTAEELETVLSAKRAEDNAKKSKLKQDYEALKHDLIMQLVPKAAYLSGALKDFKKEAFQSMDSLYELLCSYSKRHAEGKGNFSIELDNNMRISYSCQTQGYFDERSTQAEKHIIDFVNKQFADEPKTKKLITSLLERKKGHLDIKLVQKLYAMENEFEDNNWIEGIKLLKESWTDSESKSYIRFEVKMENEWKPIILDYAKL